MRRLRALRQAAAATTPPTRPPLVPAALPASVLVVEPYVPLQQLLLAALAPVAAPLQPLEAAQALGWLTAQPARLLLVDVDLTDPRSVTQAQALTAAARQQGTPVLVLTAWERSEELEQRVPAEAYLAKPFHIAVLRLTVQALLALTPAAADEAREAPPPLPTACP